VIVTVPAATPVTTPVVALTEAMAELEELQDPPLTDEVNEAVEPIQSELVPLIVPAEAAALMVTKRVAVALAQPPVPVTV
jgi:hypothetical protein